MSFGSTGTTSLAKSYITFGGSQTGATTSALTVVLTNTGAGSLTVTSVAASGGDAADFTVTTSPATACGTTLAAAATCTISVTFTPSKTGLETTKLVVTDNSLGVSGSTHTVTVTGFGENLLPPAVNTIQGVIAVADTLTLTTAQCGDLVQVGKTTGEVVTLPAPVVGCSFDFVITVSNTSNYNEIETDGSSHFLLGAVSHSATGIAPLNFWADGAATLAIKMDGAHLGGLIGSRLRVTGVSSTQWQISGTNECTATCTTAFTATP